jgi:hypothetical protein
MNTPPLIGRRWQLLAASTLIIAWALFLLMMAIAG